MTPKPPSFRLQKTLLSIGELPLAFGFGFAVFVGTFALGCAWTHCVDWSGVPWAILGFVLAIVFGCGYWVIAMRMGVARLRRRLVLDGVVIALAIAAYVLPQIEWRSGMGAPPAKNAPHKGVLRIAN